MNKNRIFRGSLLSVLTLVAVAASAQLADAGIFRNVLLNRDAAAAAAPVSLKQSADPNCAALEPAPCAPVACCPTPCITYRHLFRPIACCGCPEPMKMVLSVKNPCSCNCCEVPIPVCLPGCCTGEPKVSCFHGLFACGCVQYDWCCGVSVVVKFKRTGEVIVTYHHA